MQVVHDHRLATWSGAAVTIGNFDGVHVGHRALTSRAIELARAGNLTAVALTFEPHPAAVLGQRAPARLSSAARKLELLADAGLDATVVEPFTRELAALTPEAFLDQVLLGALRARAIVVGYDFNYGCARAGTIDTLRAHGARAGIEIAVVSPVEVDGTVASSSKIRSCLGAGTLADATRLLGRAWDVDGVVVHGAKRGRAIGIPTANIAPDSDLPLAPGIYAVTLAVEGGPPLPAVASLGTNPTFVEDGRLVLEVHVLDWDGDLYDRRVRTTFVARIRDELKYTTVEALVAQIHDDIARARELLR
ncbi:MAG: bifunctional riboflavin kinase/FAD synthetase [Kofleriaceae bacterium]